MKLFFVAVTLFSMSKTNMPRVGFVFHFKFIRQPTAILSSSTECGGGGDFHDSVRFFFSYYNVTIYGSRLMILSLFSVYILLTERVG